MKSLKDNEKRRVQEAKQAEKEKQREKNKDKRKDGVKTKLKFQDKECIIDKLLIEIRQGFPLKKRQKSCDDEVYPNTSTTISNKGKNSGTDPGFVMMGCFLWYIFLVGFTIPRECLGEKPFMGCLEFSPRKIFKF